MSEEDINKCPFGYFAQCNSKCGIFCEGDYDECSIKVIARAIK